MIQDLKMTINEYNDVAIESLQNENHDKFEIINVRFKTINDTAKVNSNFVKLEAQSKNKSTNMC